MSEIKTYVLSAILRDWHHQKHRRVSITIPSNTEVWLLKSILDSMIHGIVEEKVSEESMGLGSDVPPRYERTATFSFCDSARDKNYFKTVNIVWEEMETWAAEYALQEAKSAVFIGWLKGAKETDG